MASSFERPVTQPSAFVSAGVLAVTIGLGTTWMTLVKPLWSVSAARSWTAAECTVTAHQVRRDEDEDGVLYSNEVTYRYPTPDGPREGHRATFSAATRTSDHRWHEGLRERFPAGATVPCRVDPDDPSEAVLDASRSAAVGVFGLFGPVFVNLGLGFGAVGVLALRRPRPPSGPGRVALARVEAPAFGVVAGILALLDAVGAVAYFGLVGDDPVDAALALLALAAVPFAAWFLVGRLRRALAPRLALAVAPATFRVGRAAEVVWGFGSGVGRASSLRLALVCRRRESGGEDRADRVDVVERVAIVDAEGERADVGLAEFVVPETGRPSGPAGEVHVDWVLESEVAFADGTVVAGTWPVTVASG